MAFSENTPPIYRLPGFPTPRGEKIPLTPAAMGPYADTLTAVSENWMILPQIAPPRI